MSPTKIMKYTWHKFWFIHKQKNSEELREKFSNFEMRLFLSIKISQKHFSFIPLPFQNIRIFIVGYPLITEFPFLYMFIADNT